MPWINLPHTGAQVLHQKLDVMPDGPYIIVQQVEFLAARSSASLLEEFKDSLLSDLTEVRYGKHAYSLAKEEPVMVWRHWDTSG